MTLSCTLSFQILQCRAHLNTTFGTGIDGIVCLRLIVLRVPKLSEEFSSSLTIRGKIVETVGVAVPNTIPVQTGVSIQMPP